MTNPKVSCSDRICEKWLKQWPPGYMPIRSWWRHQMETFSALLAFCVGKSPVPGKFPSQRPVTRSFDVFFDLRLNKRLSKQSRGWWFETQSRSLWRHCNGWHSMSQCFELDSLKSTFDDMSSIHCASVSDVDYRAVRKDRNYESHDDMDKLSVLLVLSIFLHLQRRWCSHIYLV